MIYNGSNIVVPTKPYGYPYTAWIVGREKGRYYFPETNGCILTNRPDKVVPEGSSFGSVPGAYSASGTYSIGSPIAGYAMAWDAGSVSEKLYRYGFDLSSGDAYAFPKDEYSRVYNPDTNVQEYNFYYRNGSNPATSANLWAGTMTRDAVKVPVVVMQGKLTACSYYAFIVTHAATGGVKEMKFVDLTANNARYSLSPLHTLPGGLSVYRWKNTFDGTASQALYLSHPIVRFKNSYSAATKPYQYDIFRIYIMATVEIAS